MECVVSLLPLNVEDLAASTLARRGENPSKWSPRELRHVSSNICMYCTVVLRSVTSITSSALRYFSRVSIYDIAKVAHFRQPTQLLFAADSAILEFSHAPKSI